MEDMKKYENMTVQEKWSILATVANLYYNSEMTSHIMNTDYSEVKIIGSGVDAVDFALVNMCLKGDIAVTQDYGVAAMVLSKGGYCIHQSGKIFTDDNIGGLLMDRYLAKKARISKSKNHLKGPKKRTQADDKKFETSFENLIKKLLNN